MQAHVRTHEPRQGLHLQVLEPKGKYTARAHLMPSSCSSWCRRSASWLSRACTLVCTGTHAEASFVNGAQGLAAHCPSFVAQHCICLCLQMASCVCVCAPLALHSAQDSGVCVCVRACAPLALHSAQDSAGVCVCVCVCACVRAPK